MKRNDWILLTSIATYSFFFYEQSAGINFLLFALVLMGCLLGIKKSLLKQKTWQFTAIGCLMSATAVCLYGNEFAVVINIISLSILSIISIDVRSSVILSLVFAMYSYVSSPVYMIINTINKRNANANEGKDIGKKAMLIGLPVLISLVFFFMYRSSSTLFDNLTSKINLDFISWAWIFFTLGGAILLYGFFRPVRLSPLSEWDTNTSNELSVTENNMMILKKEINITDENFSGKLLFVLLNCMLFIVNALDFNFLFIDRQLPQGISYSQFVHQGITMLITSIILAIAIILFYFRGRLNFYERNKAIKFLAYLWIIQNGIMLFSSACRNLLYVHECGLTYKRIGVYVYLLLTVIGLITTLVKILKAKSNIFLFRINGWTIYGVLILFSLFRWDTIITRYNLSHNLKFNDLGYLVKLSNSNIPDLLSVYANPGNSKIVVDSLTQMPFVINYSLKLYNFLHDKSSVGWRSWCYDDQRVYDEITSKPFCDNINYLNLSNERIPDFSFEPLKVFTSVEKLDVHNSVLISSKSLSNFPLLKYLDINSNKLVELNGLSALKKLEYLDVCGNSIMDYSPIYKLTNLKELYVTLAYPFQYKELKQNLPNTIIHSNYN